MAKHTPTTEGFESQFGWERLKHFSHPNWFAWRSKQNPPAWLGVTLIRDDGMRFVGGELVSHTKGMISQSLTKAGYPLKDRPFQIGDIMEGPSMEATCIGLIMKTATYEPTAYFAAYWMNLWIDSVEHRMFWHIQDQHSNTRDADKAFKAFSNAYHAAFP